MVDWGDSGCAAAGHRQRRAEQVLRDTLCLSWSDAMRATLGRRIYEACKLSLMVVQRARKV